MFAKQCHWFLIYLQVYYSLLIIMETPRFSPGVTSLWNAFSILNTNSHSEMSVFSCMFISTPILWCGTTDGLFTAATPLMGFILPPERYYISLHTISTIKINGILIGNAENRMMRIRLTESMVNIVFILQPMVEDQNQNQGYILFILHKNDWWSYHQNQGFTLYSAKNGWR